MLFWTSAFVHTSARSIDFFHLMTIFIWFGNIGDFIAIGFKTWVFSEFSFSIGEKISQKYLIEQKTGQKSLVPQNTQSKNNKLSLSIFYKFWLHSVLSLRVCQTAANNKTLSLTQKYLNISKFPNQELSNGI